MVADTTYRDRSDRVGFTLVELLVVIAIIGVLLALMLSAVQASREAARATQCKNNLRQVSHALLLHHDSRQHFPSGGWSYRWLPEPDGGDGKDQPGSWIYSILPELEEEPLRRLGVGMTGVAKYRELVRLVETPIAALNCPSRRAAIAYTVAALSQPETYINQPSEAAGRMAIAARSDYAGCSGGGVPPTNTATRDRGFPVDGPGPGTIEEAKEWDKVDPATGLDRWQSDLSGAANGVIITRNPISMRRVTDGASKTYLAGEKFLETEHYDSGYSNNDDQNAYAGFDRDNQVSARYTPLRDTSTGRFITFLNANGENYGFHFGSAHPAVFHAAMCDGSVRAVAFAIDLGVHRAAGSRDENDNIGAE